MIAVIFGGQSSEHSVSCMSAANIIEQIDETAYEKMLIGITEDGNWLKAESLEDIRSGAWRDSRIGAVLSPDATEQCVILTDGEDVEKIHVDVVFPVLH